MCLQACEAAIKWVCRDNAILYNTMSVKPIHTAPDTPLPARLAQHCLQASEAAIKGVCRDNAILYDAAGVKPIHTALQHLDNHIGRAPAAARVVKWLKVSAEQQYVP